MMMRLLIVASLLVAGCSKPAEVPQTVASETPSAAPTATPEATEAPSASPAAEQTPPVPSESREPAKVMIAWATAITMRDWPLVRAYWGDKGERSGLSPQQFSARWDRLLTPKVSIGDGQQEGAAGSLYYTAPVTITDGPMRLHGEVTIRRVNDVDGATPEQLRWHIESSTLIP